jgi:hypothetical protein
MHATELASLTSEVRRINVLMSELAAKHLVEHGAFPIYVANRTWARAQDLARTLSGTAVPWEELETALASVDIVVTSTGATELGLSGSGTAIVIGGEPFLERILMWWNFIARTHEEIKEMRMDWNLHTYPPIADRVGGWIPAPEMPNVTLTAR